MAAPCVQARRVLAFEARGRAARDCELSGPLIASLIRLIALDDPRGRAGASRPSLITTDDVPCMQVLTTAHRPSPQVRREQALAAQRAEHARHGADLQRALPKKCLKNILNRQSLLVSFQNSILRFNYPKIRSCLPFPMISLDIALITLCLVLTLHILAVC